MRAEQIGAYSVPVGSARFIEARGTPPKRVLASSADRNLQLGDETLKSPS
jgi:hypothetical protein